MRKLLYGTSALVAAGLLHVDPAFAQAKESPVTLTVGGRFNFMYTFTDQKESTLAAPIRDHGIIREAEILFRGRTALNNGLRVGVHVGLEAETCADQIDESYIWFEHDSFGRAELGSTDQVGWKMFYGAPAVIPNFGTAQINFRSINAGAGANPNVTVPQALLNLGNDAEHINYFTPRFFGFQVGVSYTPENCQEVTGSAVACTGGAGLPANNTAGQQGDIWEVAANFVQKFGDFNVGVYGAYAEGDLEAPVTAGFTATSQIRDQKQWGVGGSVGAYGFTLGAHYKSDNLGQSGVDYDSWAVGLTYKWDAWTVGADYGYVRADNATAGVANGTKDRTEVIDLGVQWAGMGPGINLWAGVQFFDTKVGTAGVSGNDGTNFVLGTLISY